MAYGTYSRGFRSGGYAARRSRISSAGAYDPEYVDMFEAGLKALALEAGCGSMRRSTETTTRTTRRRSTGSETDSTPEC